MLWSHFFKILPFWYQSATFSKMGTAVLPVSYLLNSSFQLINDPKNQPLKIDGSDQSWTKVMKSTKTRQLKVFYSYILPLITIKGERASWMWCWQITGELLKINSSVFELLVLPNSGPFVTYDNTNSNWKNKKVSVYHGLCWSTIEKWRYSTYYQKKNLSCS